MSAPISIYLTNLGKYNEGELVGEWVELPVDDNFEQAFQDIGINDEYEEWFITDYETDFGMSIDEYDDIYELNEIAEELENLDETDKIKVKAYLSYFNGGIDDAINSIDDAMIYYDCSDMTDVAYAYVDEIGGLDELGENALSTYFDYESFGRDIRFDLEDMAYSDWEYEHDEDDEEEYESPYETMSDTEIAYYYIDDVIGDISELGKDTLSNYFDYEAFGRDMSFDGTFVFIDNDCVEFR